MHRFRLRSLVAFGSLTAAVLTIVLLSAGSASAAGWPDGPWTGSGTATTTVTSDGTSSNPVFDYSVNGTQGTWTFSANAKTGRTQPIVWHYKGYHAWFQVTVQIQQFVIHNGQETDTTLRSAGPVNCCSAPSGGFDYAGTAAFNLQAGDVYGFHMSGSNADSDRRLIGTLSLSAPVSATNPGNQAGTVGVASSLQLAATGGTSPYTWSATGLPAGLSLNPSTGVISGTPSAAGAFTVTVTATDAATPTHTTDSATFTWTISAPVSASNPGNQAGTVGLASSLQLAATGGTTPSTWSATGLPAGLSLNPSSGAISGTPTTAGTSTVTVTVSDAVHRSDSKTFTWTINPPT